VVPRNEGDLALIRAKSRASLTPADMEFILDTLSGEHREKAAMTSLLEEKDFMDRLLERDEIFNRMVEEKKFMEISPYFYFYIMIRHGFKCSGIDNREVSDYIATLLVEFAERERLYRISGAHDEIFHYIIDLIGHLEGSDSRNRFLIRTHIGNYSLFLLGLFIDYIRENHKYGRYLTGVEYYESMGSVNYRMAADNQFAEQLDLVDVLTFMGDRFHDIRKSLNNISKEYFHLRAIREN
jgi:hypothetical protein